MQQLILGTGTAIWWVTEPHFLKKAQLYKTHFTSKLLPVAISQLEILPKRFYSCHEFLTLLQFEFKILNIKLNKDDHYFKPIWPKKLHPPVQLIPSYRLTQNLRTIWTVNYYWPLRNLGAELYFLFMNILYLSHEYLTFAI